MNLVFETDVFSRLYAASETVEREWIRKVKRQLAENLCVGKPLRFSWLREKKLGGKRLFYLINETSQKAILVAFGSKKEQQATIERIIANKEEYLRLIA